MGKFWLGLLFGAAGGFVAKDLIDESLNKKKINKVEDLKYDVIQSPAFGSSDPEDKDQYLEDFMELIAELIGSKSQNELNDIAEKIIEFLDVDVDPFSGLFDDDGFTPSEEPDEASPEDVSNTDDDRSPVVQSLVELTGFSEDTIISMISEGLTAEEIKFIHESTVDAAKPENNVTPEENDNKDETTEEPVENVCENNVDATGEEANQVGHEVSEEEKPEEDMSEKTEPTVESQKVVSINHIQKLIMSTVGNSLDKKLIRGYAKYVISLKESDTDLYLTTLNNIEQYAEEKAEEAMVKLIFESVNDLDGTNGQAISSIMKAFKEGKFSKIS